jgi:hypothetical protein
MLVLAVKQGLGADHVEKFLDRQVEVRGGSKEKLSGYRDMMLGRRFEDKCAEMYYRGKMLGFVHLYNGQEAVSTGVIKAMKPQYDWFCSTYRDHVHALSCGVPAREVMSELFGKETGCSKGRGGSMHLFSKEHHLLGGYAFIGEGIPVALGAAFTSRYKRDALGDSSSDSVTAAFFGDGTCNIGQFYECLNMASLWKLPIIFVVENNKWAIGMDHNRATSEPEIWRKAAAFGHHGDQSQIGQRQRQERAICHRHHPPHPQPHHQTRVQDRADHRGHRDHPEPERKTVTAAKQARENALHRGECGKQHSQGQRLRRDRDLHHPVGQNLGACRDQGMP